MKVPSPSSTRATEPDNRTKHLPEVARAAYQRFLADGDAAGLDPLIVAILEDFIPKTPATPLAQMPGGTLLVDDLGFDSLAITEVVFFTEDLFGISISNDEILQVRSLDDLRGFIRAKVAARPAR